MRFTATLLILTFCRTMQTSQRAKAFLGALKFGLGTMEWQLRPDLVAELKVPASTTMAIHGAPVVITVPSNYITLDQMPKQYLLGTNILTPIGMKSVSAQAQGQAHILTGLLKVVRRSTPSEQTFCSRAMPTYPSRQLAVTPSP